MKDRLREIEPSPRGEKRFWLPLALMFVVMAAASLLFYGLFLMVMGLLFVNPPG